MAVFVSLLYQFKVSVELDMLRFFVNSKPVNKIYISPVSSDGEVRVFTQDPDKVASPEILAAHEAALASAPVASQPLGDIKVEDLPGPDALDRPGLWSWSCLC